MMSRDAQAPAHQREPAGPSPPPPTTSWSATIETILPAGPDASPDPAAAARPAAAQPAEVQSPVSLPAEAVDDDQAVVQAVLGGDRDAFRVLVEREGASVIRACQRILGDLHEAEDVAQEAFVIAYRSLASWRGDGPFGAWLARIAVRDAVRRASRRREVAWVSPAPEPSGVSAPGVEPYGPAVVSAAIGVGSSHAATDPAVAAIRSERTAAIRLAVARLDEPYREVIALRFFADRSLAEIAHETGRPLATVKTHLRRGLLRLRDQLADGDAS